MAASIVVSLPVTDNFTGAAGALGAPEYFNARSYDAFPLGCRIGRDGSGNAVSDTTFTGQALRIDQTFPASQTIEVQLSAGASGMNSGGTGAGIYLTVNNTIPNYPPGPINNTDWNSQTAYEVDFYNGVAELYKNTAGSYAGPLASASSITYTDTDTLTVLHDGAGGLTVKRNGSTLFTYTDGSPLTNGNPSFQIDDGSVAGTLKITSATYDTLADVTVNLTGAGALTLAGQSLTVTTTGNISLTNGVMTLAGQPLSSGFGQSIGGGALGLAGQTISAVIAIAVDTGAMFLAGQTVTSSITNNLAFSLTNGALTLSGQSVTGAFSGGDININIDTQGALTLQGQSISASFGQSLTQGAMTLLGQSMTALTNFNFSLSNGDLHLKGQDLGVSGGGGGNANDLRGRDGRRRGRALSLFGRA